MEDNNKRNFDDFFKRPDEERERSSEPEAKPEEKASYYYSYGPYKSSMQGDEMEGREETTTISASGENDRVEVTPPRPMRPFEPAGDEQTRTPVNTWTVNHGNGRRRTSVRSMFAAFMAGALVIGSLMFVSDRMNLFGGDHALGGPVAQAVTSGGQSGSNNSGEVRGASLDVQRPGSISQIVQQSSPAVVKIDTYVKPQVRSRGGSSLFDDPFFRQFFGGGSQQQPQQKQQQQDNSGQLQQAGLGSGFIFDKSGLILTNEHVIDGADEIRVQVQGYDKEFVAKKLGSSYDYDLAVLQIQGDKPFPTLPIGNSDELNLGDWVVAIGNPYGYDNTVTVGVLSAKERSIQIPDDQGTRNYKHLLQTDAAINPGNSGGPLLNLNGQVIGINTAVNSQAQGIGFAISTSTIQELLPNLKNNVNVSMPWPYIGVSVGNVSDLADNDRKQLGLSTSDGAILSDIVLGGPAFKAGLKTYDVVTAINGDKIAKSTDLVTKVQGSKPGDKLTFTIIRDGKSVDIPVTVGDQNADKKTNGSNNNN